MSWTLWTANPDAIDAAVGERLRDVLDAADSRDERRYGLERDRHLCRTSRWLLRMAIARRIGMDAADIRFQRDDHGRPSIAEPAAAMGVAFSVAHTDGLVAVVEGPGQRVGVDVELAERDLDVASLAATVLTSEERSSLVGRPAAEQQRRFLELWVAKEAVLKALGVGLLTDPAQVSVRIDDGTAVGAQAHLGQEMASAPLDWTVSLHRFGTRHVGATALPGAGRGTRPALSVREWRELL